MRTTIIFSAAAVWPSPFVFTFGLILLIKYKLFVDDGRDKIAMNVHTLKSKMKLIDARADEKKDDNNSNADTSDSSKTKETKEI
jgi:hypothetical protein